MCSSDLGRAKLGIELISVVSVCFDEWKYPCLVYIGDFGISAQLTDTIMKRRTVIGSPYWMAPGKLTLLTN